jgi:hypothetical protein
MRSSVISTKCFQGDKIREGGDKQQAKGDEKIENTISVRKPKVRNIWKTQPYTE